MDLLPHNQKAYDAVIEAFKSSHYTCVVHPTGSGKSYIALQLIEEHPESRILYVTSYAMNLDEFQGKVENLIGNRNVTFSIYKNLNPDRIFDFIILDEFHRAGAPEWSKLVALLEAANPDAYYLGLSATPIRYLDNMRDMSAELFDGNVASEITLHDAIIQRILPYPKYIAASYSLKENLGRAEKTWNQRVKKNAKAEEALDKARKYLENADGLNEVFRKNMPSPVGKYIVFCRDAEHLNRMMSESEGWFSWCKEVHRYKTMSQMKSTKEYDDFISDDSDTLRLLFCIDMLNEGVHVPKVDGCIFLRPTTSYNVYYQQAGRGLQVEPGIDHPPIIFDIVNNVYLLKTIREFWEGVQRDASEAWDEPDLSILTVNPQDVEFLRYLDEFYSHLDDPWDYYYSLVETYHNVTGNLRIPADYVADGHHLFQWLNRQRHAYKRGELRQERVEKLDRLGIDWGFLVDRSNWDQKYEAAVEYYEEFGDLNVVRGYVTEDGFPLGMWIKSVRNQHNVGQLSEEKTTKMEALDIVWNPNDEKVDQRWMNAYRILLDYLKENGTSDVPVKAEWKGFKLGQWMQHVRYQYAHRGDPNFKKKQLSQAKIDLLEQAGVLLVKDNWMKCFQMAKAWYDEHGNLKVPKEMAADGQPVLAWLNRQRQIRAGKMAGVTITQEHIDLLDSIGFEWELRQNKIQAKKERMYALCERYFDDHGNLDIPVDYMLDGENLGKWVRSLRAHQVRFSDDEQREYDKIGMVWAEKLQISEHTTGRWEMYYRAAERFKAENGHLNVPRDYTDNSLPGKLRIWLDNQRTKKNYYDAHINEVRAGTMKIHKERMLTEYQVRRLTELGLFDESR